MRRGDIYLVALDPASGHEQRGRRPVLILSPEAFNLTTSTALVAPVTTGGGFARSRGFAVSLEAAGTRTQGFVLCSQLRTLDIAARQGHYLERLPQDITDDVLARVATILT